MVALPSEPLVEDPPNPVQYRLVMSTPFDATLGRLPAPLSWTYTKTQFGIPTLDVTYPERGFRGSMLTQSRFEVVLQWRDRDVEENAWQNQDDCRMILLNLKRDRVDKNRVITMHFVGMGYYLTRAEIFDPTTTEASDGISLPYRRFLSPNAGQLMLPIWNAAVARIWTGVVANDPGQVFNLTNDANGVAWAESYDGRVFFKTTQKLSEVEELIVEHGLGEPAWTSRSYRLYNFGTYGRDFTNPDNENIVAVPYNDVSAAPEELDWSDIAGRVTVIGKGGRKITVEGNDFDTTCGILEFSMEESTIQAPDDLERAAATGLELGRVAREQITREWKGQVGFRPLRDYRCRDLVWVQRGQGDGERLDVGDNGRWLRFHVTEISITYERNKGYRGYTKFADKHEDRLARKIRRALRHLEGRGEGGIGGPPESEEDIKAPAAPLNVAVTITLVPGEDGISKGQQVITWDAVTTDDSVVDPQPIELRAYEIGEKRAGGVIAFVTQVRPNTLTWTRPDLVKEDAREIYVRAVSIHGVPSAWSDDADGTIPVDEDPVGGPNSLIDPFFRSAAIREQRDIDAGAGFDFTLVSSRYYGDLTTTTPVFRMARVGPGTVGLRKGRVKVNEGELWVVGVTGRNAGTGTVNLRVQVVWYSDTGSTIVNISTTALTGSDQTIRTVWTVPSGAREASWRCTVSGGTGSYTARFHTPTFERQTSTERMEDAAVIAGKIATDAVIAAKIQADAVTNPKIFAGAVTNPKIGALAVDTGKLGPLAVTDVKLGSLAVTTAKVDNLAITNGKTADDAQDPRTIGSDAIETVHLSSGLDVDGTITTGSGLTIGGISASDIDFPGSAQIADTGSGLAFHGVSTAAFDGSGTYTGTWLPVSIRASKDKIKPISVAEARKILELEPVTFKRRDEWMRERTKRVIPAKDIPARWERDPDRPGRKRWAEARHVPERIIPGRTDHRRYAGFIAEDVEAKKIEGTVGHDDDGKLIGSNPTDMVPYLLRVLQDQDRLIKEQAKRLDRLESGRSSKGPDDVDSTK